VAPDFFSGMRRLKKFLGLGGRIFLTVAIVTLVPRGYALAEDVSIAINLSQEEAQLLKQVLGKDEFLAKLTASQKGLSAINGVLSKTIAGPVSLAVQWNQALIDGWGKANSSLATISKAVTCDQLMDPIINNSSNSRFFEKLRKARQCD
jgi:hypothetical protein